MVGASNFGSVFAQATSIRLIAGRIGASSATSKGLLDQPAWLTFAGGYTPQTSVCPARRVVWRRSMRGYLGFRGMAITK
jgi:hypothetical protein